MDIQSNIKEFFAGDNLSWVISSKDYSSVNDYVVQVVLISSINPKVEFIADSLSDGSWIITKTASETSTIIPGNYSLFYRVYKSTEGFAKQFAGGIIKVNHNILSSDNFDFRTENQKLLDVVRERISGRLTEGMSAFTINGRSVTLIPFTELLQIEKTLENKVNLELTKDELKTKGRTNRNKLVIRYTGMKL